MHECVLSDGLVALVSASFPNAFSSPAAQQLQQAQSNSPAGKQTEGTMINYVVYTWIFMPMTWKVRRGHLVIGLSVCPSLCLSVILSRLQTKCNIFSLGDETVTKLGLQVHLWIPHTLLISPAPGGRVGSKFRTSRFLQYFDFVATGGICVSQAHVLFLAKVSNFLLLYTPCRFGSSYKIHSYLCSFNCHIIYVGTGAIGDMLVQIYISVERRIGTWKSIDLLFTIQYLNVLCGWFQGNNNCVSKYLPESAMGKRREANWSTVHF